jgi:NAD(P)-dependent dehydrogenase (short-subunit alcohol dehydrogenase family)
MLLEDKVAIITGGARGIGRGIALKFAEEGCSIVIGDVLEKEAEQTVAAVTEKGRQALFVRCDVSDSAHVHHLVEQTINKFAKIDILVNNAGIGPLPKPCSDISEEEWDRVLSINLKGVFLCSRAVVPHMKEKKYGKIINMSSMAAIAPPAPMIFYSSSKAGLLGFTRDLALELAPFNICVNAILPGVIRTYLTDRIIPPGVDEEEFYQGMGEKIAPMGRIGTPEDVAGVALFLASGLSQYVTGDRVIVGGGLPLTKMLD